MVSCLVTDGIGGLGRAEASGLQPATWVVLLFIPLFVALLTAFISASDDVVVGSTGRGMVFGAIGLAGGLLGGLIAFFVGNFCLEMIADLVPDALMSLGRIPRRLILGIVARAPSWMVCGIVGGAVIGALGRSWRRVFLGAVGGGIGGLAGGLLFDGIALLLREGVEVVSGTPSRAIGLAVMGMCTGLAIASAEAAAKSAWVVIEQGRLVGKQFILYRNPTTLGSAFANDVYLFKDPSVHATHAKLVKRSGRWHVEPSQGALVRVNGQTSGLRTIGNGDTLQIGETVIRFYART